MRITLDHPHRDRQALSLLHHTTAIQHEAMFSPDSNKRIDEKSLFSYTKPELSINLKMIKYWFVLDQTHYEAPVYVDETYREACGTLLLGHIIPGIKSLDQVINRDELPGFPRTFRVQRSTQSNVSWSRSTQLDGSAGASAGAPALAGVGISIQAGVKVGSTTGGSDSWEFDQLETQAIAPTTNYIQDCIRAPQVAAYVKQRKILGSWKLYMITGIKIGKGAKLEHRDCQGKSGGSNPGIDIADAFNVGIEGQYSRLTETSVTAQYDDAFIWAVRLLEISGSWFHSSIGLKAVTTGTTLGLDKTQATAEATALAAGLDNYCVISSDHPGDDEEILLLAVD
ncbi:hypothetical protein CABS01_08071 [Colletotrichum abscissum]|uniref:uncharacterized protein n=1 Tax=Colletotrichum abscissum TaxID=1671311 RepID=UPI0027D6FCB4|nr:uncharacterized protein CABS01_08071 [Colletotrichum abscissum]KAK1508841.1 hypothetical protein CABS01_08071 [Colletotrichum abscissum]